MHQQQKKMGKKGEREKQTQTRKRNERKGKKQNINPTHSPNSIDANLIPSPVTYFLSNSK
jgi:hypothetical protein